MDEFPTLIAFDLELMRPGCAMVQAGLGGDPRLCAEFESSTWLTHLTPDMRVYRVESHEQLLALVHRVETVR